MSKSVRVTPVLKEMGKRLRAARERADLTQEEASHRAGMDPRRWQRMEQGETNPTVKTLARAADALGLSFWELVGS